MSKSQDREAQRRVDEDNADRRRAGQREISRQERQSNLDRLGRRG